MTDGITVSDAGPLHYLILIGELRILPALFGEVFVPDSVRAELLHPNAPEKVRQGMSRPEPWLKIGEDVSAQRLRGLHVGESAAISLSQSLGASNILMDDLAGRRVATTLGLQVFGTVGILEYAANQSLIDLANAFSNLRRTNFHVSDRLLMEALNRHASRQP